MKKKDNTMMIRG